MKIILSIFFVLSFIEIQAQPVKDHGQLKLEGVQLKDSHGADVVLRGMSFGWHNWWPRFYNGDAVKWLYKDWKCSIVRAAMGIEPDHGYLKDPEGSKRLIRKVIDGAIRQGIYVIIDWHSHNINLKEAKEFFIEMATEYGSYPNVIYEIFNEPDNESWKEVKDYSITVISAIRKIDPDNIILVGTPHWDQDIHIAADDPIKGFSNIIYTLHYYAATQKQSLRDRGDYALKKGLPLFISESAGMEATGDGKLNEEEWNKWIEWSEKNRISWITWSIADKDETCSVLKKTAGSKGKWKEKDLKESGIKTRTLLRKYNSK